MVRKSCLKEKILWICILGCIAVTLPLASAQFATWTYLYGPSGPNIPEVTGPQGVSLSTNLPGARTSIARAYDASRNFLYIFGGIGYLASSPSQSFLGDLWRLNGTDQTWTWLSGYLNFSLPRGDFGEINVTAPTNRPSHRYGSAAWIDTQNQILYIFGGQGFPPGFSAPNGLLDDLWKFNLSSGLWTWIGGSNTTSSPGNYGPKGDCSTAYYPRARRDSAYWFDEESREAFLFGGIIEANKYMSDLWKWKIDTGEWCFIKGSVNNGTSSVVGTRGIEEEANTPGARAEAAHYYDQISRDLYLFVVPYSFLQDLWRYSVVSNNWTFVAGLPNSAAQMATPVYGERGVPSPLVRPGSRSGAAAFLDSLSRSFFLFGGRGRTSNTTDSASELWRYSLTMDVWEWVLGPNTTAGGSFIQQGVPDSQNSPGSRNSMAYWYSRSTREFFVFGGSGYANNGSNGLLSDVWRFFNQSCAVDPGSCPENTTCVGGFCLKINGIPATLPEECGSGFLVDGVCCNSGCLRECNTCFTGTCESFNSLCFSNQTCSIAGSCLFNNGVFVSSASQCASGIRAHSGHCCNTQCPVCSECSTSACLPIADKIEPDCPEVDCIGRIGGWLSLENSTCTECVSNATGRCTLGQCSTGRVRCDECGTKSTVGRESCASADCRFQCPVGELASLYNSKSLLCKGGGDVCEGTGQCTPGGICRGGISSLPPASPPTIPQPEIAPILAPTAPSPVIQSPTTDAPQGSNNAVQPADITGTVIGASIGAAVLVIIAIIIVVIIVRKRNARNRASNDIVWDPTEYASIGSLDEHAKTLFNIKATDLNLGKLIGEGSYGVVYKGAYKGEDVAVKKLNVTTRSNAIGDFFRECGLMMSVKQHPNVARLIGMCQEQNNFSIVMEFMEAGSLESYIRKNGPLDDDKLKQVAVGVARGMKSLNQQRIIHRDLASRNILLTGDFTPKISDFGMARVVGAEGVGQTKTDIGPIRWMAPETIDSLEFSEKSDVWSYACLLLECVTGKQPWDGVDVFRVAIMVRDESKHPDIPSTISEWARSIMMKCWASKPEDRPSFDQILREIE